MADSTSEAKVQLLPLNSTYTLIIHAAATYANMHVAWCNAIDRISCFFIPWLRLWHGGHVEKLSPS